MTKAYSYIRFSSPEQSKGNSMDRQATYAAEYAAKHGLELDTELTFHDLGLSAYCGANAATGELAAFKSAVERGLVPRGSYLLVESLDRISRLPPRRASAILGEICDLEITVVTLTDGAIYTSKKLDDDPFCFLLSILIFMRANEESARKAERVAKAWEAKRAKAVTENKPLSKIVVGWTKLNDARTEIEVIPERAEIIRQIFQDRLNGMGRQAIAMKLNESGVRTWGVGGKAAKHWHQSYVDKILRNRAVIGVYTPHTLVKSATGNQRIPQKPIPDYYPRVIDDITFQRVQALLENNGTRGRKTSDGVKNVLSYLAKCPICGSTVTRTNKGERWQYLVCTRAKAKANCKYQLVRYDNVEDAVIKALPKLLPVIGTDSPERQKIRLQITKLEIEVRQRKEEISRLISLVKSGELDESTVTWEDKEQQVWRTVREEIQTLEIFISKTSDQIETLEAQYEKTSPRLVDEKFHTLLTAIKTEAGLTAINAALREVFSSAVIDYDQHMVIMRFKHRDAALPIPWDR